MKEFPFVPTGLIKQADYLKTAESTREVRG